MPSLGSQLEYELFYIVKCVGSLMIVLKLTLLSMLRPQCIVVNQGKKPFKAAAVREIHYVKKAMSINFPSIIVHFCSRSGQ